MTKKELEQKVKELELRINLLEQWSKPVIPPMQPGYPPVQSQSVPLCPHCGRAANLGHYCFSMNG